MSFKLDNIQERDSLAGFQGLRYAAKPSEFLKPQGYQPQKPQWGPKLFETMNEQDKKQFEEEDIEAARFLDSKKALAGKSRDGDLKNIVTDYEDRPRLAFDPVSADQKEQSGAASYDSGQYAGGENLLNGKGAAFSVPVGSMANPNPYRTSLDIRLK